LSDVSRFLRRALLWWARRRAWLRWGVVLAEMALLWWSSSRRLAGIGRGVFAEFVHNGAHVVAYGVLAAAALLAMCGVRPLRRVDAVIAVAITVAYGLVDELHQSLVPGRVSSFMDLAADAAGATLGVALVLAVQTGESRWRRPAALALLAAVAAVTLATCTGW
jgi:VanZ family protein